MRYVWIDGSKANEPHPFNRTPMAWGICRKEGEILEYVAGMLLDELRTGVATRRAARVLCVGARENENDVWKPLVPQEIPEYLKRKYRYASPVMSEAARHWYFRMGEKAQCPLRVVVRGTAC